MNKLLLISVLVIAFIIRFLIVMRGDEMFDEISVIRPGEIYIGGFKNLNFSHDIWIVNYEHPPVAKYIFGLAGTIEKNIPIIHKVFDRDFNPDKGYFLPKLTSTFIGIFIIFLVYVITTKWFDEKKAFFASLFLALMPHFIVHNTIAGLETPQVLFSLLLVWFYVEGLFAPGSPNIKKIYLSFVCFALLFLTKFTGLFFLFFYLAAYIYYLIKQRTFDVKLFLINLSGGFVSIFLIYALWPWLWLSPFNIQKSFGYFTNGHTGEYFFGSLSQPPWYYYFAYVSAMTPPLILLSFFAIAVFWYLKKIPQNHKQNLILIFIWFLTPFLISFVGLKQDGIRYVFSYIPALAILAGYSFSLFLDQFDKRIAPIISMIGISTIMWSLTMFYPYYLDYYNIFYGGTQTVYKNHMFDYDWWGEGIHEAVSYVNQNFSNQGLSVSQMLYPQHTAPLYDESLFFLDHSLLNPTDLVVLSEYNFYYNADMSFLNNYKEIHRVNVNSTPLVRIYRRIGK